MMMTMTPPLARDTSLRFRLVLFVLTDFCKGRMGVRFQAALLHAPCKVIGVLKWLGGIIWEGVAALTGQEHSQVYSVTREQSSLFLTGFTSLRCRLESYVVFVFDVLEELGAGLEILAAHCTFVLHLRVSQLCPNANNTAKSLSYRGSLGRLVSRLLGPLQLGLVQLGLARLLLGR